MGFKSLDECETFKLVQAFKLEVYRLVKATPEAWNDLKWRGQLYDALLSAESNVDEGFHRNTTRETLRYLTYARSSAAEARRRLRDGVHRTYFSSDEIAAGMALGGRALGAMAAWQRSLRPFLPPPKQQAMKPRTARGRPAENPEPNSD